LPHPQMGSFLRRQSYNHGIGIMEFYWEAENKLEWFQSKSPFKDRLAKQKSPDVRGTRYNIISLLTYLFFAFLAAFFLGAAFFLAAFFFVAMFLNLKWLVKKLIDSKNRKFFKLSKVFSTFLKTWMWKN